MSMPPFPMWLSGAATIVRFLGHRIHSHDPPPRYFPRLIEANGRPALLFERSFGDTTPSPFAVQVIEVRDAKIAVVDHFMTEPSLRAFLSRDCNAGTAAASARTEP